MIRSGSGGVEVHCDDPRIPLMFAAKFLAETTGSEPPITIEPTDENLTEIFKHCVRPPSADRYPAIREAIASAYPSNESAQDALPLEAS